MAFVISFMKCIQWYSVLHVIYPSQFSLCRVQQLCHYITLQGEDKIENTVNNIFVIIIINNLRERMQ